MENNWVPVLPLKEAWLCLLVGESSLSKSSSSSSSIDAQARSFASAMANCSATPKSNTSEINQCRVDSFSFGPRLLSADASDLSYVSKNGFGITLTLLLLIIIIMIAIQISVIYSQDFIICQMWFFFSF